MHYKVALSKIFRVTIPIELIRTINPKSGEYVRIVLRKSDKVDYFYLRVPSKPPSRKEVQVRRKLPERIIQNLQLIPNNKILIGSISKLEIKKLDKPFVDNKFDLLFLPLEDLMIDTFIRNGEEWCRFWSSSKFGGIAKEVELKRFIPINRETGELFGLMQAESRKHGEKFDFTNILISEHKKFLEVSEILGVNKKLWKFGLIYNPSLNDKLIENYIETFSKELKIENSYITKSNSITTVAYQIYIPSKILNQIMNFVLQTSRKLIPEEARYSKNRHLLDFCKGFLIKDLVGDGTVILNKDMTHLDIILSEENLNAQEDIIRMLNLFGIHSKPHKNRIDISTNFDSLIWFLDNNLFVEHKKNREKMLRYIKHNYYFNTLYERLEVLNSPNSINKFAQMVNLNPNSAQMYLLRNKKRGFITSSYTTKQVTYYASEKGKHFLDLIGSLQSEN